MMIRDFVQGESNSSLRWKFVTVSAIIVSNFFIGIYAPILVGVDDEVAFFDTLWRVVVGQHVGIDYHNSLGFGPYLLGAGLWHWLGPHYYVMRLAISLFSLSIAFCGCIVAEQTLSRRTGLAWLFCVTLAFQLSAPTIYESGPMLLGIAGFYNRQIVSALAVLFLLTFSDRSGLRRDNVVEIAIIAFLLNILFLLKISGLIVGLVMLLAGCLFEDRTVRRVLNLCIALLAFAAMTAIEFEVSGLEFTPVIQEYELAAHARLAYSFYDIVQGMFTWPLVTSVALLLLFALSRRRGNPGLYLRPTGLVIGSYAACQYAINMTNSWDPSMWLAPAAVAILAARENSRHAAQLSVNLQGWWRQISPSRLDRVSVREAIPLAIFVLVLARQVGGSLVGATVGTLIALDIEAPYFITAGKGVSFKTMIGPRHHKPPAIASSYNEAVAAISSLDLGQEAIANLDSSNPFPVLFLAPPPKGIPIWFYWDDNVPQNAVLRWQEVIGDACVVTIPGNPMVPETTARLVEFVRSKLETDFELVFHNESWKIYRRTRDCAAPYAVGNAAVL